MIPILYEPDDLTKLYNGLAGFGLGFLSDCISATVIEERNGIYELQIEYPINGILFEEVKYCSWIKAKPFVGGNDQIFRVYKITKPLNGICTIYAEHVSYMLAHAVVKAVNLNSEEHGMAQEKWPGMRTSEQIMELIANNILDPISTSGSGRFADTPFTFTAVKYVGLTMFNMTEPKSVRQYLLDDKWSILSVYGDGEFKWDNFDVYFYDSTGANARGSNKGVRIQYGQNLTNLKQDISDESIITGFYPYWHLDLASSLGDWGGVYIYDLSTCTPSASQIQLNPAAVAYFDYYPRIIPIDLAEDDEWKDTVPESTDDYFNAINKYINEHPDTCKPIMNLDVSFVDLSCTEEYKNIVPLEEIQLCDIVTVEYPKYGVDAEMKVTRTEYNVLAERYNKVTLGTIKADLSKYLLK